MALVGDRDAQRGGTNALAIAAVAAGLLAVPLYFFPVPAALAIVLGVIGHRRARDLSGEVMAAIGATTGIVVLGFFVVLLVLNFYDVSHTTPLIHVATGTCLKETYPEDIMIRKECSDRHGSELFAVVHHPAPGGAPIPSGTLGPFELNAQALDLCEAPFAEYVGVPHDRSTTLTFIADFPSDDEWRRGDRTVRCFVIAKDGAPALTGSVRATGNGTGS